MEQYTGTLYYTVRVTQILGTFEKSVFQQKKKTENDKYFFYYSKNSKIQEHSLSH